ncbi:MAG: ABC transporter permease [Rhodoglobus sp.]
MNWLVNNIDLIAQLTVAHLSLSLAPILCGLVIALPLGWIAYRCVPIRGSVLGAVGALYTIPSLALLPVVPAVFGTSFLSPLNLTIVLTIYAVAIMVRSVAEALDSVDSEVKLAAVAMGYGPWHQFWAVELPLAGPVILAGLRVTAMSTISLVTVGILIGVESLGYLLTNGSQRRIIPEVVTGVVMVVLLALLVDFALARLGRLLMPWAVRHKQRAPPTQQSLAPVGTS